MTVRDANYVDDKRGRLTPAKDEGEGNELFVLLNDSTGESWGEEYGEAGYINRYSTESIKKPCSGTLDDSMADPGF
jgi:hypothetical protein